MLQPAESQTDSDMEEPQGCLNMPSGLSLSHWLNGWKWVALLEVFFVRDANQFQSCCFFLQPLPNMNNFLSFPQHAEKQKFSAQFPYGVWETHTLTVLVEMRECVRSRCLNCLSLWVTGKVCVSVCVCVCVCVCVGGGVQQLASHLQNRTRTSIRDRRASLLLC